jgi:diaminohydroxyphosphoribosylaminopyrimidine deaminase/5-amino-6-(5-phosphoribosylamino)uracil reductase
MAEPLASALDQRFLAAAIHLGAGALGTTWPNPAVGAILVKDGRVVGRGRTARGGRPHGETIALAEAGTAASGATLYVSLEPCSHYGRTPPCADALAAAGVARVVAPLRDPDPRVAGAGFARLEKAGIEVVAGVLAAEAMRAQVGHVSRVTEGRPHVVLKLAVSADDALGRKGEGNVSVTGERARRHVQALRSRFDAVLVGRGTVEADDPELTCRLPGLEHRSPVRVVLDTEARLGKDRRIFAAAAPSWLLTAIEGWPAESRGVFSSPRGGEAESARSAEPGEGAGVGDCGSPPHPVAGATRPLPGGERKGPGPLDRRVLGVPRSPGGGLDLPAVLERLANEGITRVMVEGGARVARSLLQADLVDEIILFRSPRPLGGDIVPALAGLPLSAIENSPRYRRVERRMFGPDCMTRYLRVR